MMADYSKLPRQKTCKIFINFPYKDVSFFRKELAYLKNKFTGVHKLGFYISLLLTPKYELEAPKE